MTESTVDTLRSAPAIARPPARERTSSDLWRLLPYLMPYRGRWVAMVAVALVSLVATVAIPLMTKAVIDGPVRHQDQRGLWVLGAAAMGVGISEAVLWFIRRWLVARATMAGFLVFDYVDRFPEAVADMSKWLAEGRLKSIEYTVPGDVGSFPDMLARLFSGQNTGKLVLELER